VTHLPPLAFRRLLRARSTDAERALWNHLRRHALGPKFRRQHTLGRYTLDFFCSSARLAIELDGGQHYDDAGRARDAERDEQLGHQGIRVLRFSDAEVLLETEVVLEVIWAAIRERLPPLPDPLPPLVRGERG
jgi:very-short-patch-repair endonuclease